MSSIYDKATKLLKIRPHHSEELTKKLMLRGFKRDEIEEIISTLTQEKLIDNDAFAQAYLEELIRNKILGYFGFKAKLMQRGITSNDADKLLKENLSIEDEKMIAMKIIMRGEAGEDRQTRIKLAQKLQRKGFRSEVISQCLAEI